MKRQPISLKFDTIAQESPKKVELPRKSEVEEKPIFTFNKKNHTCEENDDKSISSIAKNQSEFSRDFQLDLFDADKKYLDHCKNKQEKRS